MSHPREKKKGRMAKSGNTCFEKDRIDFNEDRYSASRLNGSFRRETLERMAVKDLAERGPTEARRAL